MASTFPPKLYFVIPVHQISRFLTTNLEISLYLLQNPPSSRPPHHRKPQKATESPNQANPPRDSISSSSSSLLYTLVSPLSVAPSLRSPAPKSPTPNKSASLFRCSQLSLSLRLSVSLPIHRPQIPNPQQVILALHCSPVAPPAARVLFGCLAPFRSAPLAPLGSHFVLSFSPLFDLSFGGIVLSFIPRLVCLIGITLIIVLCMILDLIQELSERSDGCGYVFIGANSESLIVGILLMNMESSRSHCAYIFTVQRELKTGKLILLDLAGSKKIEKIGAEGKILEEAKTINKSLSAPGNSFCRFDWDSARCSCRTHNGTGVVVVGNQKSGLDIAVECASLIHTASDSPAGKSMYSLIREPGELVKIKYTDVPLLYYSEILSMPEIIRLIMATVGRGGHGDLRQRIRDEILLIQGLSCSFCLCRAMMEERGLISRNEFFRLYSVSNQKRNQFFVSDRISDDVLRDGIDSVSVPFLTAIRDEFLQIRDGKFRF
ncbi:hypothetical protein Syun_016971 [Stephania yunnanensis]|uniref:Kinesin motor domain-containing protein n=1 Tax=Stephania yunnanensis TaxID=152371 RepID=A0AAP0J630_9MAGN